MAGAEVTGHERFDTPTSAYRLMPARSTVAVVAFVLAVAAAGWVLTLRQEGSMSGMVMGLGQVGGRMAMGIAVTTFMGMWTAMMVAMMAPAVTPVTRAHRDMVRQRGERALSSAAFVVGFLAVWSIVGVVALVAFRWFYDIPASAAHSRWLPTLAGAGLVVAGALLVVGWW